MTDFYCDLCQDDLAKCRELECPGISGIPPLPEAEAQQRIKALEAELKQAVESLEFTREWYACRIERLMALAKERGFWAEMAAIIANGTANAFEPPTYAQQFNMMIHRMATAERKTSLARSALWKCIQRFRLYAALHTAKGTPEGNEKAATNTQIADESLAVFNSTGVTL